MDDSKYIKQKKKSLWDVNIDQGGEYCHKDASEAYDRGFQMGLNNITDHSPKQDLADLGYSQKNGLNQRHKSCPAAYSAGFKDGQKEYKQRNKRGK